MSYKVFISHAAGDREVAKKIAKEVEKTGGRAFYDSRSVRRGDSLARTINETLRKSDLFVAIVSKTSAGSAWLSWEVGAAVGLDKRILLIANNVKPKELPPALKSFLMVDAQQAGRYLKQLAADFNPERVAS